MVLGRVGPPYGPVGRRSRNGGISFFVSGNVSGCVYRMVLGRVGPPYGPIGVALGGGNRTMKRVISSRRSQSIEPPWASAIRRDR